MAKAFQLKERTTNEDIYPITKTECIEGLDDKIANSIEHKADRSEIPNVKGEPVIDEDTFPDYDKYTIPTLRTALEERPPQWLIDAMIEHFTISNQTFYSPTKYCSFNEQTNCFEANGLTDITPSQAIEILGAYITTDTPVVKGDANTATIPNPIAVGNKLKVRTIPPITIGGNYSRDRYDSTFKGFIALESVRLFLASQTGTYYIDTFYKCVSLKTIIGPLNGMDQSSTNAFYMCSALENVTFYMVRYNFNFKWSPKLSYNSVKSLIDNSDASKKLTHTIHPDVYAKLTGDTSNPAVAELSEEELAKWTALMETAVTKNLTFVTT